MLLKLYFLVGKLTYILGTTGKDRKAIDSEHDRMKSIPAPCIKYYAQAKVITVLDVCKKLFNNKTIKFDLPNDSTEFVCRDNKDYTIPNVSYFTRKCQNIRDESDKFFIAW